MPRNFAIYYVAFASGAAIMALEVIGLGMLAPYFGTALSINTNVIGIILISLTIGYRLGGMWADTSPPKFLGEFLNDGHAVGTLLCTTAFWIGLIFPWRGIVSNSIGWIISSNSFGAFFTISALFGFPGIALGMVLPYLIKLRVLEITDSGRLSGMLYGISAIGSIFGTFLIGLFVLPRFQYEGALASVVGMLIVGALLLNTRWQYCMGAGILSLILLLGVSPPDFLFYKNPIFYDGRMASDKTAWRKLADETSVFSRVQVYEGTEKKSQVPVRFMVVNGEVHSASYLDSNELVFNYARYNRLGGHFNPAAKRALLIGGGAYSYANYFLTDTPLYDIEKVWKLDGELYHNNKTIALPVLVSSEPLKLKENRQLVYVSPNSPVGRQTEGSTNKLEADNQMPGNHLVVRKADILNTGFSDQNGYVHIHETKNDGTPGRIISPDVPFTEYAQRPRTIIGTSTLISLENSGVIVRLDRPSKDGEILYPMLHRDNGNKHFDEFLLDGYEQIEALDVVEIDPRTTALAERYFHLNRQDPRLRIFHEDGRTYLNRSKDTYDIIYLDAFQSFYGVPWQLTTIEATKKLFDMLNANGVVVANVPAALKGEFSKFFQAEFKTYRTIFPEVRAYAVFSPEREEIVQNVILVAFKNKETIRESANDDQEINEQLRHRWLGEIDPKTGVLTDDFAPTDYYTNTFVNLHSF